MLLLMMMLTATTAWGLNVTCRYYDNASGSYLEGTGGGTYEIVDGTKLYVTPATGYYIKSVTKGDEANPLVEENGYYTVSDADNITITFKPYTNNVRVRFNMKGHGTAPAVQDLHLGDKATRPTPDPTAWDAIFLGWYTNSDYTTPYDFATVLDNKLSYSAAYDSYILTIYAKWHVIGGSCGTNATWVMTKSTGSSDYDVLTISGTGAMKDYNDTSDTAPWYQDYRSTIKTVVIDEGVTKIGICAFENCDALTSVTIPASVTSIGNSAFYNCAALTSVTIPAGVTSIGKEAFDYCTGLTHINIPASVTSIGKEAFDYCTGLTYINIPASVTSIGNSAFDHCQGLTSITVYATAVPTLGFYVFDNNASGRKIYVFSDLERDYESAKNWREYDSAIYPITLGVKNAGGTLGSWTTYYNGLADVTVSEGTTIYKAALSGDKKSVTLTQVSGNIVKRGEAVLLKSSGSIKLSSAANGGTGDYTDNALRGVDYATTTSTLGEGTFYVLGKVGNNFGFHRYTGTTMPAQKAYLLLSSNAAPSLSMTFGDEETTGISPIENGELRIENSTDAWYTLDGRRLSEKPTRRGIYINNGKKVFVK